MDSLLDLLWDLVELPEARAEYLQDPVAYVRARGQTDVTGEDVSAALDVVCDLVPADLAALIAARAHTAPPVAPAGGELPLEAAIRSLAHLVDAVDGQPRVTDRPDLHDLGPRSVDGTDDDSTGFDAAIDDQAIGTVEPERDEPLVLQPVAEVRRAFDPADLKIEPPELREIDTSSFPDPVEQRPFDPSEPLAPVASDLDPPLAEVVPLDRDRSAAEEEDDERDEESGLPPVPLGGFGTGGRDHAWEPDEPSEPPAEPAPVAPAPPMFSKKSGLSLPTIGVDASDWYSEDEAED